MDKDFLDMATILLHFYMCVFEIKQIKYIKA